MAFCSFADGAAMYDATPVENMFLLEYLPTAPEEFLRVYLYARMLSLHPELGGDGGLESFAAALRMDGDAVYNAFTYWEQQGLARRLTDNPPTYALLPMRAGGAESANPMERDYYEYRDFNAALQQLFGTNLMHPQEYRMANDWLNVFGFEQAQVLRMVEDEIRRGRSKSPDPSRVFKRVDKRAVQLANEGVRTLAEYEKLAADDDELRQTAQAVLRQLSLRREATQDELACARRWLREWGFSREDILAACAETTKSRAPSFAYLDSVLRARAEGRGANWDALTATLRELDGPAAQPTPDQLARYNALLARGFEPAAVRLAAIQCHRRKKTRFDDLEAMLDKWAQRAVFTEAQATAFLEDMRRKMAALRALFDRLGLERRPTNAHLEQYEAWREKFPDDMIAFAADCARGKAEPFGYMARLLSAWEEKGVSTAEAARAENAAFRESAAPAAATAPANPALNYSQRDYTDEDFGDGFFIDLEKEYGEGDKK